MTGNLRMWQLVNKLKKLSDAGKVDWEITADEGVYQASFPRYSVVVFEQTSHDPEAFDGTKECIVRILNEDGVTIEETSDEQIEIPDAWKIMDGLFSLARSRALGVDAALDCLMGTLDKLETSPKPLTDDDVPF